MIRASLETGRFTPAREQHPEAVIVSPKGPCTQIVYALAPKYPKKDCFKAKVWLFGHMDPEGSETSKPDDLQ